MCTDMCVDLWPNVCIDMCRHDLDRDGKLNFDEYKKMGEQALMGP